MTNISGKYIRTTAGQHTGKYIAFAMDSSTAEAKESKVLMASGKKMIVVC